MALTRPTPTPLPPDPSAGHEPGGVVGPPRAPAPPAGRVAATGAAAGTAAQKDAYASLVTLLNTYGLGSLAGWAWSQIIQGSSQTQVLLDMQATPQFKAAFPELQARHDKGLPPVSVSDILNYRNNAIQMMRAAGLPTGFYDQPTDFTNLIVNDVSLDELQTRVQMAQTAAYSVPDEVKQEIARTEGVDFGHLTAFFLDEKKALPTLKRDFIAGQIGGQSRLTGYGQLAVSQLQRLADLGVTDQQAQQGFGTLVQSHELFNTLPGENTTGISQDRQLAAAFGGDANAQQEIAHRAAQRAAEFAGGGTFAGDNSGVTGLGTAQGA
jgi:hypothetical protein